LLRLPGTDGVTDRARRFSPATGDAGSHGATASSSSTTTSGEQSSMRLSAGTGFSP